MHPLYGVLPLPYEPVWVRRGALAAIGILMLLLSAELRSVSFWNGMPDPVFDGVGQTGFKSRVNAFLLV